MFGLMGVARMSGQPGGAWSPLRLFAASEQGAWYDPSDFASMFQDSTGTTPVTAVGQPVGKINDKSGNGNHATQATAAARPVVSARKNWFTSTEDFTDAAWVAYNGATKSTSAFTFVNSNSYIQHDTVLTSGVAVGSTVTLSLTLSADTAQTLRLVITDGADGVPNYPLDVNVTTTPTRFEHTATLGAGFSGNLTIQLLGNSVIAAGTVVTVSEPQLETGSTATRYQRVTTASDYDTVGFPHYLVFDGVDDSLATAAIDFTVTDKMSMFCGAMTLNNANLYQTILGLGDVNTTEGSLAVFLSTSLPSDLGAYARGSTTTIKKDMVSAGDVPVVSALLDLSAASGAQLGLRLNGGAAVFASGSSGGGTGANSTIVIGLGAGGASALNGNIYSLVFLGRTITDAEITATEAYIAGKSGVTL